MLDWITRRFKRNEASRLFIDGKEVAVRGSITGRLTACEPPAVEFDNPEPRTVTYEAKHPIFGEIDFAKLEHQVVQTLRNGDSNDEEIPQMWYCLGCGARTIACNEDAYWRCGRCGARHRGPLLAPVTD